MYSRPWLAVAVYARAPAADAPIATDIAENSDSTLMYSHGASAPSFTSADSASTMCVCGEIGYAAITSGRHSATASATAFEPSICLSTGQLSDQVVRGARGGDVARGDPVGEALVDRCRDGVDRDRARRRGERAEQRGARDRSPQMLARKIGRGHGQQPEARLHVGEPELTDAPAGVDDDAPAVAQATEDVDLVEQRRVLHDQCVGTRDRLVAPDRAVVDPAERDDRRAGALGAEARERLRVAAFEEGGDRQKLGGRDDALAAAPVDADLKHRSDSSAGAAARHRGLARWGARRTTVSPRPGARSLAVDRVEDVQPGRAPRRGNRPDRADDDGEHQEHREL